MTRDTRCTSHFDGWRGALDVEALDTGLGVWVADIPASADLSTGQAVEATFYWTDDSRWEGRNVRVAVAAA
jgi:hypothetical protein